MKGKILNLALTNYSYQCFMPMPLGHYTKLLKHLLSVSVINIKKKKQEIILTIICTFFFKYSFLKNKYLSQTGLFENATLATARRSRATMTLEDLKLVRRIQGHDMYIERH